MCDKHCLLCISLYRLSSNSKTFRLITDFPLQQWEKMRCNPKGCQICCFSFPAIKFFSSFTVRKHELKDTAYILTWFHWLVITLSVQQISASSVAFDPRRDWILCNACFVGPVIVSACDVSVDCCWRFPVCCAIDVLAEELKKHRLFSWYSDCLKDFFLLAFHMAHQGWLSHYI